MLASWRSQLYTAFSGIWPLQSSICLRKSIGLYEALASAVRENVATEGLSLEAGTRLPRQHVWHRPLRRKTYQCS